MSLFYGDVTNSLENRKNFLRELGIDYRDLICLKQIHGSNARYARESDRGKGALSYDSALADSDALITNIIKLPLAVFTADCLCIFLYDPLVPSIGIIHAGWHSSKENITDKTVRLMQKKFNVHPEELYVGFGPAIRQCCYEVREEFNDYFSRGLIRKNKKYYLDLVGINKKQLLDLGVKDNNIFDSRICTSCRNENFFSYRKEGNTCGRMISVIMLK